MRQIHLRQLLKRVVIKYMYPVLQYLWNHVARTLETSYSVPSKPSTMHPKPDTMDIHQKFDKKVGQLQ